MVQVIVVLGRLAVAWVGVEGVGCDCSSLLAVGLGSVRQVVARSRCDSSWFQGFKGSVVHGAWW
jgi:hypothetical protein